jgi:mRNA interferase RelE/StbE
VKLPSLAYWRVRRGLSQAALAEKAGLSRVNVGNIETGRGTRPATAKRLADALTLEIDDLMRRPPD